MHWAPADCPTCCLVSVNVYSQSFESEAACHEYGSGVAFYLDWGVVPEPPDGWPCPDCGRRTLAFSRAKS